MAATRTTRFLTLLALGALVLAGCEEKKSTKPEDPGPSPVMPDFALVDVNPNSATYDETVSPRECLGQISCWYFGHAT
jgi:hypothetical protein